MNPIYLFRYCLWFPRVNKLSGCTEEIKKSNGEPKKKKIQIREKVNNKRKFKVKQEQWKKMLQTKGYLKKRKKKKDDYKKYMLPEIIYAYMREIDTQKRLCLVYRLIYIYIYSGEMKIWSYELKKKSKSWNVIGSK